MKKFLLICSLFLALSQCEQKQDTAVVETTDTPEVPFLWENANIYFLLTDRFNNGNPANDLNFERNESTAVLRGFEGGDILGITQKIKDGYFSDLGIMPLVYSCCGTGSWIS